MAKASTNGLNRDRTWFRQRWRVIAKEKWIPFWDQSVSYFLVFQRLALSTGETMDFSEPLGLFSNNHLIIPFAFYSFDAALVSIVKITSNYLLSSSLDDPWE